MCQFEVFGEVFDVFDVVEDFAVWVRRTPAVAWSVDGDDAQVKVLGFVVEGSCFDAGPGQAMEVEKGMAGQSAVLRIAELAAVWEVESRRAIVVETETTCRCCAWRGQRLPNRFSFCEVCQH